MTFPKKLYYDIDLVKNNLLNAKFNPLTSIERLTLSLGVDDEGYATWDTTLKAFYIWTGTAWTITGFLDFLSLTDTPNTYIGQGGKIVRVNSIEDALEFHNIVKADVGLGNVDDTSDANKPVSIAQQAALDLKHPLEDQRLGTTDLVEFSSVLSSAGSFGVLTPDSFYYMNNANSRFLQYDSGNNRYVLGGDALTTAHLGSGINMKRILTDVDGNLYALKTTTIAASGNGITGGGSLAANRTFALDFTYLNSIYQSPLVNGDDISISGGNTINNISTLNTVMSRGASTNYLVTSDVGTSISGNNLFLAREGGQGRWGIGLVDADGVNTGSNFFLYTYLDDGTPITAFKIIRGTGAAIFGNSVNASSFSGAGTGLTGTAAALSIGGNAFTVTDGVYTTGSYTNPAWITTLAWSKITGTPTTLLGYGITDAVSSSSISGTTNYVARFTSSTALGVGLIRDDGSNVGINTAPNASYKLDVAGNTRVVGTSEQGLRVEHTNGNYASIIIGAGSSLAAGQVGMTINGSNIWSYTGAIFRLHQSNLATANSIGTFIISGGFGAAQVGNSIRLTSNTTNAGQFTATSGTQNTVNIGNYANETWAPSSGTAVYNLLHIAPTINTTGSYAGTVRGIYYNPTLTSVTGTTHNFIESTQGNWIVGGTGTLKLTAINAALLKTVSGVITAAVNGTDYISTISGITAGGELTGTYPNPSLSNAAVIGKLLTGFTSGAGTVTSSDSILSAIQKLDGNLSITTSSYIPYTGATSNVDLNTKLLTSSNHTIVQTGNTDGIGMTPSNSVDATRIFISNATGRLNFGVESSTGSTIHAAFTAYSSYVFSSANRPMYFGVNNSLAMTIATNTNITMVGTLTAASFSGAGTGLTGTATSLNIGGLAANSTLWNGVIYAGPYLPLSAGSGNPLSGALYSSITSNLIFSNTSASTSKKYFELGSTGATLHFGIESSAGGGIFTGSTGYASVFGTTSNTANEFATNGIVRYSISGAGDHNFKSGTGTFGNNLFVGNTSSSSSALIILQNSANGFQFGFDSTGTSRFVFINGAPSEIANINGITGVYTALSDARLKKNIKYSTANALDILERIKVREYNWKSNNLHDPFALVAQELYEVIPEYVYKPQDEKGSWGISKAEMVPLLIKSIQELNAKVNNQETVINRLMSIQN